jgi:hypothetical protein
MRRTKNWARLNLDLMSLGVEASEVMALRMLKLAAGGPAAAAEAERMVGEKIRAAAEIQAEAWAAALTGRSGGTPRRTVARYRKKVRANRQRLSRRKRSSR